MNYHGSALTFIAASMSSGKPANMASATLLMAADTSEPLSLLPLRATSDTAKVMAPKSAAAPQTLGRPAVRC